MKSDSPNNKDVPNLAVLYLALMGIVGIAVAWGGLSWLLSLILKSFEMFKENAWNTSALVVGTVMLGFFAIVLFKKTSK